MKISKLMNALAGVLISFVLLSCSDEGNSNSQPSEPEKEALVLSHNFGILEKDFTLTIQKRDPSDKIYYTLDGSRATASSQEFPEEGLEIKFSIDPADYRIVPNTLITDGNNYTFGYLGKGEAISLLETDKDGNEIARKQGSFIITNDEKNRLIPSVCLTIPQDEFLNTTDGFYNSNTEEKYPCYMEYIDPVQDAYYAGEAFIKRGGNASKMWTQHTINVNFNKNWNGKKNTPPAFTIFEQPSMTGGSLDGKITRFRLHNGGNSYWTNYICDAYIQSLIGNKTKVGSGAYRPALVYINGEYFGVHNMREHQSDDFIHAHYGVKKSDILFVEKGWSETGFYGFKVQEGDKAVCQEEVKKLMNLCGYRDDVAYNTNFSEWINESNYGIGADF